MFTDDAVQLGTVWRDVIQTATTPATHIPLIVVKGAREGPTLLVTAGVHGAEYASIEAANRLALLDPQAVSGTLIVLPVINQPSFAARSVYVNPLDGKNLNRVFPGKADGSFTEQLAFWLTHTFIAQADIYIDLHGGDLNEALAPFVLYPEGDQQAQMCAYAFGLKNVVASSVKGSSYIAGATLGVPSIVAEAGGQGQFPESDITLLVTGVKRVMQEQGMLPGELAIVEPTSYEAFVWLRSSHTGFWYLEVAVEEVVTAGQRVGFVKDFRGEVVQEAVSPVSGKVLFTVASLAINDGDPLVGIGA